ncbi:hydroxyisourate hydrolase [Halotalea alkalilenta]|uniref:hydroxyisourate hydrolase n=1 Tax=Halotalea alkalilenta TaxID=376489 RepID=UPI000485DD14|nr:hydroxyisourate hydrolase [Halotalea alkalilenta]
MTRLSTHVLDQRSGKPAAGVLVTLTRVGDPEPVARLRTNADGRLDAPLLADGEGGTYQLVFEVKDYFEASGVASPFLDRVPVQVTLAAAESYHVPLLITPWSYSVYRGS